MSDEILFVEVVDTEEDQLAGRVRPPALRRRTTPFRAARSASWASAAAIKPSIEDEVDGRARPAIEDGVVGCPRPAVGDGIVRRGP